MEQPSLLQIATRIHFALLREIGCGININMMLKQQGYALEVIYLCRACTDPELRALGECFESLAEVEPVAETAKPCPRVELHRRVMRPASWLEARAASASEGTSEGARQVVIASAIAARKRGWQTGSKRQPGNGWVRRQDVMRLIS